MPHADGIARQSEAPGKWFRLTQVLVVMAMVVGPAAFAIDLPAARFFGRYPARGDLADAVQLCEFFGHGIGVGLVLVIIATLDPSKRVVLPRIAASSWGAGLIANAGKMVLERSRPSSIDLDAASLWSTFGDWLPLFSHGHDLQSFPSGHTATAAGLAVALTAAYPRGRWLFLALCLGVAMQRMAVLAHFPSDVVYGGVLGAAWGMRCQFGWAGRFFDSLEQKWRRRGACPESGRPDPEERSPVVA